MKNEDQTKDQGSQKRSDLTLMHRRDVCAECSHAMFIRGFDSDGLYVDLVACDGGGYSEISFEHKGCGTVDCEHRTPGG